MSLTEKMHLSSGVPLIHETEVMPNEQSFQRDITNNSIDHVSSIQFEIPMDIFANNVCIVFLSTDICTSSKLLHVYRRYPVTTCTVSC